MKRKAILAAVVSSFLSLGTYFFELTDLADGRGSSHTDFLFQLEQRGFPFTFMTENRYIGTREGLYPDILIDPEFSFNFLAVIGNWISWFVFVLILLVFLDWLAGFVGKLIIRIVIGLAVAAYGLLVFLG